MNRETELIENLKDAGCSREDIDKIVALYSKGDMIGMEKAIRKTRREQLEKIHEFQQYIDRLDYLSYQLSQSGTSGIKR